MTRTSTRIAFAALALLATTVGATRFRTSRSTTTTRQIIAVYMGTEGTDARSGMVNAVTKMRVALQHQAGAKGDKFVLHGVSLEAGVEDGIRHLARFGVFDEVSVGGNWTNSAVVRYTGGDMSNHERAAIPQVVLLEREIRQDGPMQMVVGPEHELARFRGTSAIDAWVNQGAPIPR